MAWSPDDKLLLFQNVDPKTGWDIWVLPLTGDRKATPFAITVFEERSGQLSPDGRWLAYQSNESGRFEIYAQPFPGPGGKWQISSTGGTFPRWRADGKELFFIAPDGKLMAAPVIVSDSKFETGVAVPLFQTRIVSGGLATLVHQYDVSRDGRFLINIRTEESTASAITLILNWKPPETD